MKFTKTILITDAKQLADNPPQCGQWIKLAWLETRSRFHHAKKWAGGYNLTVFHFPGAVKQFNSYCSK